MNRLKAAAVRRQFSLKVLFLVTAAVCAFSAANLSGGKPQVIFQFSEEDGGRAIYASHFGWPATYLRAPTGEHASTVASDWFVPGLIVDLGFAAVCLVALLAFPWFVGKVVTDHSDGADHKFIGL